MSYSQQFNQFIQTGQAERAMKDRCERFLPTKFAVNRPGEGFILIGDNSCIPYVEITRNHFTLLESASPNIRTGREIVLEIPLILLAPDGTDRVAWGIEVLTEQFNEALDKILP